MTQFVFVFSLFKFRLRQNGLIKYLPRKNSSFRSRSGFRNESKRLSYVQQTNKSNQTAE